MDLPELQARIREHLAGRTDVRVAMLFGSRARGTARADSDVDLAVEGPGVDLLTLGAELGGVLDLEVDVVDLEDASIPLLEHQRMRDTWLARVAREGI